MLPRACLILAAPVLATVTSCSGSPAASGFDSPLPAEQLKATHDEEYPRPQRLIRLIEQLDHPDATVRLASISQLEALTGLTLDYRYDAPLHERQQAVSCWVEWLSSEARTGTRNSQ